MNNLSTIQTMTTREVAELTGKRHSNVMADTRKMLFSLYPTIENFDGHNEYHRHTRTQYKFLSEKTMAVFMNFKQNVSKSYEEVYVNSQNKSSYKMIVLHKQDLFTLISGYSLQARVKVIDALLKQEEALNLKNKQAFKVLLENPQMMIDAIKAYK